MMNTVFLKLLNLSITAGWLIAAVVLIRLIFKKKAPAWFSCVLWGLVALRLIFPFSLESVLSLIPSSETVPANIGTMTVPKINSGIYAINSAVNPIISENSGNSFSVSSLVSVLSVVWVCGMAALLIYTFVVYMRLRKSVSASIVLKDNVMICDDVKSPFIIGLFRPKIYIPSSITAEQAEYVIAHEQAHIKRHDHWWKPFGFVLLSVYWFNPLCWVAYILLCRDIEKACDEKIIRTMDNDNKIKYSETLLQCSVPRKIVSACPLAFGEVGVKERIKFVLNYKKPAFWVIAVALVAGIGLAVCFLTNPVTEDLPSPVGAYSFVSDKLEIYTLNLKEDNTFIFFDNPTYFRDGVPYRDYSVSTYKFYLISGTWEYDDDILILTDNTSHIEHKAYFEYKNSSLLYDKTKSADFDNCNFPDKTEFTNLIESDDFYFQYMIEGTYICKESGFGSPFQLTLNADHTCSYYAGILSSYIGLGTWEVSENGKEIIITDTQKDLKYYFTLKEFSLAFNKSKSDDFTSYNLADKAEFKYTNEKLYKWYMTSSEEVSE